MWRLQSNLQMDSHRSDLLCLSASWIMTTPLPASPQWYAMEEPHTVSYETSISSVLKATVTELRGLSLFKACIIGLHPKDISQY